MPSLVKDENGSFFIDTGGGVYHPVNSEQAATFLNNPGTLEGMGEAALQGGANLVTGAGSLLSDNPAFAEANKRGREQSDVLNMQHGIGAQAAQFAPQVAGGALAAAAAPEGLAGAGIAAGVEGLMGAFTTPETPVQGAILGAAGAGVASALPGLVQAGVQQAKRIPLPFGWGRAANPLEEIPINPGGMGMGERPPLPGEAPPMAPPAPSANPPDFSAPPGTPPPAPAAPRMAERVEEKLSAADASSNAVAGTRVMEGTMTPAELYAAGVPTLPGQRALLSATADDPVAGAAARELMGREAAQASQPFGGQQVRNVLDAQQQAATNYLTKQLDLPAGINLTDPMLSDITRQLGDGFDNMAKMMGDVPITPEIRTEFADIMENARLGHKGQIERIVDQVNKFADQNGGNLSGDSWQEIRTKLNKLIDAGTRQGDMGKISDATELMNTLTKAMESGLPDAARAELETMRKQYAIAMTLFKPGARNADGQVNPLSFYNKWNQGRSTKTRATDDVGRFMNTMVTLTQKRMPDSGTAGRLLEAAGQLPVVGGVARGIQTVKGL